MGVNTYGPVLVVEDEPSIRELLVDALEHEGLRAIPARDGAEALRLSLEEMPGLVVLDMGLPLIDGAAVAAKIREHYGDAVPFIVVTAGRAIDDAASRVRASSYIAKPFDIEELMRAVRSVIGRPADPVPSGVKPQLA